MAMHSEAQALPGLALSWRQLAGVAGIVGVILFVIGFGLMADAPTANDSVDNVRSWFEDNGSRLLAAYYLITIGAVIFLVPFFLGLRSLLAEAEGGEALWTQLGFLGGVLFIVLGSIGMTYWGAISLGVDDLDDGTIMALMWADEFAFSLFGLAWALYFIGTGLATLRTGVFWSWLGGLEVILAVVTVIGAASMMDRDPEGVLAGLLWIPGLIGFGVVILLQSVGLLTRKAT